MTRQKWLLYAEKTMKEAGIADTGEDAWLLLSHVTGLSRIGYTMEREKTLTETEEKQLSAALKKRLQHIPVQQITGEAWFFGYPFKVNENVLIPRLDTEVLVDAILQRIPQIPADPLHAQLLFR